MEEYAGFEQGPIRPPSEAGSLLLRLTRNCPWNKCAFCPVYKGAVFSRRPVAHVLRDIDAVRVQMDALLQARRSDGSIAHADFLRLAEQGDRRALHAANHFLKNGMRSIFLQDGNSLILKPDDLVRILEHLAQAFPGVERVTSYARSKTLARISDEDLARIAAAGLNRIHIGMESGSDAVLQMIHKGADKATQVLAGQKVKRAGMELSEYYMPGLGGRSLAREHALETADALNRIGPDFIRLRTLALPEGAPLTARFRAGEFDKQGEVGTVEELELFLRSLEGISSTVKSDHVLNLFAEVDGVLPEDKEHMLAPLQEFLALPPQEQMLFCIGRRGHALSRLSDLRQPRLRRAAEQLCTDLGATPGNMEAIIDSLMKRYI